MTKMSDFYMYSQQMSTFRKSIAFDIVSSGNYDSILGDV